MIAGVRYGEFVGRSHRDDPRGEAIEDFAESDLAIAARFLSRIREALLESQHQTT